MLSPSAARIGAIGGGQIHESHQGSCDRNALRAVRGVLVPMRGIVELHMNRANI